MINLFNGGLKNERGEKRAIWMRRARALADSVMMLNSLERREMLSVSATTLAGPLITNSSYTYQEYYLGQTSSTLTNTIVGSTTFNNTPVTEIDQTTGGGNLVTHNYYAFDSAGDYVNVGSVEGTENIKTDSGQTGTIYPATMTAGQTYTTSYTETVTTQYGSGTQTVSDSFSLGNTTSVSVPLGTFPVVEVDDTHVVVNGYDTFTTDYQYYFNPTIGLVEYSALDPNVQSVYGAVPDIYKLSNVTGLGSLVQTPTQLTIAQQPSTAAANATLSSLVVDVKDANGTLVSTDNSNVTLTLSAGNGTLGGTVTEPAVGGVATFSDLTISSAGNYTITASDGNLTSATSTNIRITGGLVAAGTSDLTIGIAKSTLPSSVVAGTTAKGTISTTVFNIGNGTYKGNTTVTVYASSDGTVDGSSISLGSTAVKNLEIKAGKSSPVSVSVKSLPLTLDGDYRLYATVTNSSGNVTTSAVGPALTAAAPFLAFSQTFAGVTGVSSLTPAIGGTKTNETLQLAITNNGNIPSTGNSTVALYASPDTTVANGTLIRSVSLPVILKPGATKIYSVKALAVPNLANGNYHLVVQLTDPRGDVTTKASALAYPIHAAYESLVSSAPFLKTSKNGTGAISFTVTNEGNVPSTGNNTFSVVTSTTGSIAGATMLVTESSGVVLAVDKPKKFTLTLSAAEVNALEASNFAALDITDANGAVQTLTLSF